MLRDGRASSPHHRDDAGALHHRRAWNYATTLAYGTYVLHDLGDRVVLTAGPHEFQPRYRRWLPEHPIVVISDDPETFTGFHVRELDDGSPHLYALR